MNTGMREKMPKTTGLQRQNNEQYYTQQHVADTLVDVVSQHCDLSRFDAIVEPSAGTGVFIEALSKVVDENTVVAYDIEPKHASIQQGDFLKQTLPTDLNILVIGNPPFGRQSSLAKQFIKHSCTFASTIAFILPLSFKKESMTTCFDMYFHKVYEQEMDPKSFTYLQKMYAVPCVFQIWKKQDDARQQKLVCHPNNSYMFTTQDNMFTNVAFRRVGGRAGIFVFDGFETDNFKEKLNSIEWQHNNTVGPKSISKQELIRELNKTLVKASRYCKKIEF